MTDISHQDARSEVLSYSQDWIKNFNQGNAEACVTAYTHDAVMRAKPMGVFTGTESIANFWKPFIASGATDLEYHDVQLEFLDESTAILSASWSMNVGRGVITAEKWVKQQDGRWLLQEDDFEVLEQFT